MKPSDNKILLNVDSPITITLPEEAASGERYIFPNYDPALHVLRAEKIPNRFGAGDYIEYRKKRTVAVSVSQTEPRWRQLLRTLSGLLR